MFDLLNISLYHGWLVDPQDVDRAAAIGSLSYNQLVEKIIESKESTAKVDAVSEGICYHLCVGFYNKDCVYSVMIACNVIIWLCDGVVEEVTDLLKISH